MKSITVATQTLKPSKIICVGRNYQEHIQELGNEIPENMVLFVKPNSAISNQLRGFIDEPLHYEGEICFVINDNGLHAVGFGLDLTKRGLQSKLKEKGLPWERAKAFDGAACFSDFVLLGETPVESLSLILDINGKETQNGGYPLMMYKPQEVLDEISDFMTLNDGDIVMTGTPKGVGVVNSGDQFVGKILAGDKELVRTEWLAT